MNIDGTEFCTQGFDPDRSEAAKLPVAPIDSSTRPLDARIVCDGDGVSGKRVQAMYVHPPETNRYAEYLASFQQWVKDMDDIYNASAAETSGTRHVRLVHDGNCLATILNVEVSSAAINASWDPTPMWSEVAAQGYNRTDRIYVIFAETNSYNLGVGNMWWDDTLGAGNRSNRGPSYTSSPIAMWGGRNPAHELMHTLGAVNASAPNFANSGHCSDEYDRMCYGDNMRYVCTDPAHEERFDCNHDDYFHTDPLAGSYLATHWNTANNSFLIGAASLAKTWTGATSTHWSDGSNWSPAGVPGSDDDCLIPAGKPRYPVLGSAEATCSGALVVEPGAQITVGPVGGLTAGTALISGTVQVLNGSYFDINSAAAVWSGGVLLLQNGDVGMMFPNGGTLSVNGMVRVTGTFPIYGTPLHPANLLVNPGGLVEILEGGQLTVDGVVTNTGTLSQTKTVLANAKTSFLTITATNTITRYYGVDITLGAGGNLGRTSVSIQGNQMCSSALGALGMTVARCYSISPTTPQTATIKFYYRSAEALGNPSPNAYHWSGSAWNALTSTRGDSGEALWVQATNVRDYSPFALKDPAVPTYSIWLPIVMR